jgi:multidrug efflux pump subunit AcrB
MSGGRFNLSALAVRERSITVFLIVLIALLGTLSFFKLGRAEDPPFTVKQMTVISAWPGATAPEDLYPTRSGLHDALVAG